MSQPKTLRVTQTKPKTTATYYAIYEGYAGEWVSHDLLVDWGDLGYNNVNFFDHSDLIIFSATDVALFSNKEDAIKAKEYCERNDQNENEYTILEVLAKTLDYYAVGNFI